MAPHHARSAFALAQRVKIHVRRRYQLPARHYADTTFRVPQPRGALIMASNAQPSATSVTRERIEEFLYAEADLLDNWRLSEWLALFDPEATGYFMPTTDLPDGDPATTSI